MKTLTHTANRQPNLFRALGIKGLLIATSSALFGMTAFAQLPGGGLTTQVPVSANQASAPGAPQTPAQDAPQESQGPQTLHLLVGHSLLISSPTRITRVSLADPAIADAVVISPYQVLVNGKAPGGVSLIIWDESGQSQNFEVSVDIDILGLTQKVHEVFPGEPVQIETSGNVVMLSGKVSSQEVADKILEVVKDVTPKVTSLIEVPAPQTAQISLQVRFAEVNRTAISQFGVNILRDFGSNMPMSIGT
ncbi:MAG: pilus assembly protein N-terminal domain-containing protein, partial [Candidatus Acidiferrales bacterium]